MYSAFLETRSSVVEGRDRRRFAGLSHDTPSDVFFLITGVYDIAFRASYSSLYFALYPLSIFLSGPRLEDTRTLSSASWPSLGPSPLLPFFPPTLQVACSIHVEPTIYANATLKVPSLFLEVSTFQESETFLLRASNSDADTCLEPPESQLKLYRVLLDSNQPLRWFRYRIYDIESTSRHLRTSHDGGLTLLIHAAK
jgi:hypothetical protein